MWRTPLSCTRLQRDDGGCGEKLPARSRCSFFRNRHVDSKSLYGSMRFLAYQRVPPRHRRSSCAFISSNYSTSYKPVTSSPRLHSLRNSPQIETSSTIQTPETTFARGAYHENYRRYRRYDWHHSVFLRVCFASLTNFWDTDRDQVYRLWTVARSHKRRCNGLFNVQDIPDKRDGRR